MMAWEDRAGASACDAHEKTPARAAMPDAARQIATNGIGMCFQNAWFEGLMALPHVGVP
jgi:hypothetical protein